MRSALLQMRVRLGGGAHLGVWDEKRSRPFDCTFFSPKVKIQLVCFPSFFLKQSLVFIEDEPRANSSEWKFLSLEFSGATGSWLSLSLEFS